MPSNEERAVSIKDFCSTRSSPTSPVGALGRTLRAPSDSRPTLPCRRQRPLTLSRLWVLVLSAWLVTSLTNPQRISSARAPKKYELLQTAAQPPLLTPS
jgi:hypothetical protein